MNGLNDIVARNRDAVKQGVVKSGEAVGTESTEPVYYRLSVIATGEVVEDRITIAGAAKYKDIQNTLEFTKLDN